MADRTVEEHVHGVRSGDVSQLARAITLVESDRSEHRAVALEVLAALWPDAGHAMRIGITGVPGAGKSTLIDRIGTLMCEAGRRVSVLAIDPSSSRTGGSVLGDKTRMANLSRHERAYVRPSPTRGVYGGVGNRTQEAMVLCEAAGFDVVIVETVGVGQSEAVVAEMVDLMVMLVITGAGDELQGIKRGILEVLDLLVVHKADGDNRARAEQAKQEYAFALRLLRNAEPLVLTASSEAGEGISELSAMLEREYRAREASGALAARRREQRERWMWRVVDDEVRRRLGATMRSASEMKSIERELDLGSVPPSAIAERLIASALRSVPGTDP